ncbi:WSC domain-containing protein [Colletotrichum orbiculare MAFF 240422]|uniref:WSC domain-containing protein n=1 Tax=Colletotrichum orbiculare (strain 104-T / ATCC 96160 / CBS 514.97 / LARS 414 / MAFF 240422) TaxID=1213857 RepID=N4VQI7_COLOR|nr:WSC domain-containing protein [Colletotrichum orbiculare MAFF 240422]
MSFLTIKQVGLLAMPLLAPAVSALALSSWTHEGCHHEPLSHVRALKDKSTSSSGMCAGTCANFCAGYKYFGLEYGSECWCGNELTGGTFKVADNECNMPCSGGSGGAETCGAGDRLDIYVDNTWQAPSSPAEAGTYKHMGCHTEGESGRALNRIGFASDTNTPESCALACAAQPEHYNYAGVEWGKECFCAETIRGGDWAPASECGKLCAGNRKQLCGEGGRLNIYAAVLPSVAAVPRYTHQGCKVDAQHYRLLEFGPRTAADDMTASKCASFCSAFDYFGVEFGRECFCSDAPTSDLAQAAAPETDCSFPCAGDGLALCGAKSRVNVYKKKAVVNPATVAGKWTYLECGVDVVGSRALGQAVFHDAAMDLELCAQKCEDFAYFGVEFGKECFCGNTYTGTTAPASDCNKRCVGNDDQLCGAPDRISVYQKTPPA